MKKNKFYIAITALLFGIFFSINTVKHSALYTLIIENIEALTNGDIIRMDFNTGTCGLLIQDNEPPYALIAACKIPKSEILSYLNGEWNGNTTFVNWCCDSCSETIYCS